MYSTSMKYIFKPEGFEEECRLWRELIFDKAVHADRYFPRIKAENRASPRGRAACRTLGTGRILRRPGG
jgi:hypothetical protein